MFAPGFLRGGIKTKVAESFAFGCAVIGNGITFEGLHLDDYSLLVDTDEKLIDMVKSPSSYLDEMKQAAAIGQNYVKEYLNRKRFEENWNRVLG